MESVSFEVIPAAVHSSVSNFVRGIFEALIIAMGIFKVLPVVVVRADMDLLISSGCKRDRLFERTIRCVDIKECFVREFLVLHIWIARSFVEVLVVVFGTNEPNAVILINIARVLLVLFCPHRTFVTPVAFISLLTIAPRVPDP